MAGPRDYTSGTEKALFVLSQGTCYYPDCPTPVIEFVQGIPIVNVHISHVRGAKPGSPRYDATMTDEQRASFDNVVLLCKPHHDLVDRIKPDDFPTDVLLAWKAEREGTALSSLAGLRGLTEERLSDLIETAVKSAGPLREVVLELSGGVLLATGGVASLPIEGWKLLLDLNQEALAGERALVATARNTGHLRASLEMISVYVSVDSGSSVSELTLMGRNDYPFLNPQLPKALDVGDSTNWLTSLATVDMMVKGASVGELRPVEVWATAVLGSGDRVHSARFPVENLPF